MEVLAGVRLMTTPAFEFEWDEAKAIANANKHSVSFELAMTVFLDALAVTLFDDEHGEDEDRWVTIGRASNSETLVVVHTFKPTSADRTLVRLISARPPTRRELQAYEEG